MDIVMLPIAIVTKNLFFIMLVAMPLSMGVICGLPLPIKTGFLYSDGENPLPTDELVKPLLDSVEPAFQYYGLYYNCMFSKNNNNQQEMNIALAKMDELKSNVPKLIIEDCKIE